MAFKVVRDQTMYIVQAVFLKYKLPPCMTLALPQAMFNLLSGLNMEAYAPSSQHNRWEGC